MYHHALRLRRDVRLSHSSCVQHRNITLHCWALKTEERSVKRCSVLQTLWPRHQRLAVQVSVYTEMTNLPGVHGGTALQVTSSLCWTFAGMFMTTLVGITIRSLKSSLQPPALLPSPPCGWARASSFTSGHFSTASASTLSCGWPSSSPFHRFPSWRWEVI